MTERALLAAKAKGTAFEILYEPRTPTPAKTAAEIRAAELRKIRNDAANALRYPKKDDMQNAIAKQRANWTI